MPEYSGLRTRDQDKDFRPKARFQVKIAKVKELRQ